MSYDVYLEIDTGADEPLEVWEKNYTSNVSPMWTTAIGHNLGDLIEETPDPVMLAPILRGAAKRMRAEPAKYRLMEPSNGWGTYAGAVGYLEAIAEACEKHSKCRVVVSR